MIAARTLHLDPALLASSASVRVQLALPWTGTEPRIVGGGPSVAKVRAYRPRPRRPNERQVEFAWPVILPGTAAVQPGERFGQRLCIMRTGGMALMRCDCGHQGWARARHVAKGQRDSCSKCAARDRKRGRSIPDTRYIDDVPARLFRVRYDYDKHPDGTASFEDIAKVWGVSREAVRQTYAAAIAKLAAQHGTTPEQLEAALGKVRRPRSLDLEGDEDGLDDFA